MKKIYSIFILIILLSFKVFGQAQIDIPIIVTNGVDTLDYLRVGLDTTATNGIDPHLGEADLPPIPPVDLFLSLFDLFPYTGEPLTTYRDYRNAPSFPYTGSKEHTLKWQNSSTSITFDILYNFPAGVWANFKDPFGGILYNISISDSGRVTLPHWNQLTTTILTMHYNNIGGNPVPGPVFTMHPTTINFGEVAFGQSETVPVFITNTGYQDSLIITDVVSSSPSFTFEPNTLPIILPPGQMQIFDITYTGIVGGIHIESILFTNNAPGSPHILNVRATTYEPNPNCEAQILCQVLVTDNVDPIPRNLIFGLDSSATDEIDPWLGEHGPLPPFPPAGAFEAQLFLPENNFSGTLSAYCDFRHADLPFTGQREWRLAYQASFGADITIIWDFPEYMTGTLLDIINGTFINVPMVGAGSFTVTNPETFNRLRMIIDFNITTPVKFSTFAASIQQNENAVQLNWRTATETNNSGFEIQKKELEVEVGGQELEWKVIGFVPGFGTTTEPKSYSYVDEDVTSGTYKYRLKQIDFDGSFEYLPIGQAGSNEIEIEVDFTPKEFVLYQNYPNPFNPNTVIRFEIPGQAWNDNILVTLKVFDVLGNEVETLINEEKQPGVYEVEFSVGQDSSPDIASGIYFYRLKAGDFTSIKKMVLLR